MNTDEDLHSLATPYTASEYSLKISVLQMKPYIGSSLFRCGERCQLQCKTPRLSSHVQVLIISILRVDDGRNMVNSHTVVPKCAFTDRVTSLFGGPLINRLGVKWSLALGAMAFPLNGSVEFCSWSVFMFSTLR